MIRTDVAPHTKAMQEYLYDHGPTPYEEVLGVGAKNVRPDQAWRDVVARRTRNGDSHADPTWSAIHGGQRQIARKHLVQRISAGRFVRLSDERVDLSEELREAIRAERDHADVIAQVRVPEVVPDEANPVFAWKPAPPVTATVLRRDAVAIPATQREGIKGQVLRAFIAAGTNGMTTAELQRLLVKHDHHVLQTRISEALGWGVLERIGKRGGSDVYRIGCTCGAKDAQVRGE